MTLPHMIQTKNENLKNKKLGLLCNVVDPTIGFDPYHNLT
jgi:hypothetical protein